MSEKQSENSEMSELVWASRTMRELIAPAGSADSKGERIRAAALALKWKFSRAKDVWYADARVSLKPREIRKIEEVSGVTYGRKEVDELDRIISRADALLEGQDEDFYRPFVDAFHQALRAVAGPRTGTDR
jgi:hypothetical protein